MTTITIDRAVVEEALDFIVATNKSFQFWLVPESNLNKKTVTALRAALAQEQAEPLNLSDPAVQKRLATQWGYVPAALAEPVEDVLLSAAGLALDALEHDRQAAARAGRSISMLSLRAIEELRGVFRDVLARQDEPVESNTLLKTFLADAKEAGVTHLRQAEPVEPVAYTTGHCENHKQKNGCQLHNLQCGWPDCDRKPTTAPPQRAEPVEPVAGVVLNEEGRAALVEHGREEWHCVSRNARRLYIAPPQRKPLPKHDQHCVDVPGYGPMAVRLVRAVERAHGIKE